MADHIRFTLIADLPRHSFSHSGATGALTESELAAFAALLLSPGVPVRHHWEPVRDRSPQTRDGGDGGKPHTFRLTIDGAAPIGLEALDELHAALDRIGTVRRFWVSKMETGATVRDERAG